MLPLASSFDDSGLRQLVDYRADEQAQNRIDELAEKSNDGTITPAEEQEYDWLIHAATIVALLQAEAKKLLETRGA